MLLCVKHSSEERPPEITMKFVKDAKRDVKFLQKRSDLKAESHRKDMRRKLVRLEKKAVAEHKVRGRRCLGLSSPSRVGSPVRR